MDLWYDPKRQILVDKNNHQYPYCYYWIYPDKIWFFPESRQNGKD